MMNQLLKGKCSLPILVMTLLSLSFLTSCETEWPDDLCDCHKGGNIIDDWGEGNDTTIVNKKDSVGGFAISLDDWGDISQQDIPL